MLQDLVGVKEWGPKITISRMAKKMENFQSKHILRVECTFQFPLPTSTT